MKKWKIYAQKDEVKYVSIDGVKYRISFDENGEHITENEKVANWFIYMTGEKGYRVEAVETVE